MAPWRRKVCDLGVKREDGMGAPDATTVLGRHGRNHGGRGSDARKQFPATVHRSNTHILRSTVNKSPTLERVRIHRSVLHIGDIPWIVCAGVPRCYSSGAPRAAVDELDISPCRESPVDDAPFAAQRLFSLLHQPSGWSGTTD